MTEMMPLKNQVCTLEQAKILKELGVKLDTYFHWIAITDIPPYIHHLNSTARNQQDEDSPWYPAYSCAELWILFEIIMEHEKTHTLIYAFLNEKIIEIYKSKLPMARILADTVIEALQIGMVNPEDLQL